VCRRRIYDRETLRSLSHEGSGDKPYARFDALQLSSQRRTRMLASGFP